MWIGRGVGRGWIIFGVLRRGARACLRGMSGEFFSQFLVMGIEKGGFLGMEMGRNWRNGRG